MHSIARDAVVATTPHSAHPPVQATTEAIITMPRRLHEATRLTATTVREETATEIPARIMPHAPTTAVLMATTIKECAPATIIITGTETMAPAQAPEATAEIMAIKECVPTIITVRDQGLDPAVTISPQAPHVRNRATTGAPAWGLTLPDMPATCTVRRIPVRVRIPATGDLRHCAPIGR